MQKIYTKVYMKNAKNLLKKFNNFETNWDNKLKSIELSKERIRFVLEFKTSFCSAVRDQKL